MLEAHAPKKYDYWILLAAFVIVTIASITPFYQLYGAPLDISGIYDVSFGDSPPELFALISMCSLFPLLTICNFVAWKDNYSYWRKIVYHVIMGLILVVSVGSAIA